MKAKLVKVSLMTRVVVGDNATEEEILEASKAQLVDKIMNELGDNVEEVEDDEEMPYGLGLGEDEDL